MDDAILNSLLRLSKQITPRSETYPFPSKNWNGSLRTVEPPINLSTYYLLDNPAHRTSPFKAPSKLNSCASTSALSPPKKNCGKKSPSKQTNYDHSTQATKIFDIETEIRKAIESEEENRAVFDKQKQNYLNVKKELERKIREKEEEGVKQEFEEYKASQEEMMIKMQDEIQGLKKLLAQGGSLED